MPRCASHGPRSAPERTMVRGAGTSAAPLRHASHISSQLASKDDREPREHAVLAATLHRRALGVARTRRRSCGSRRRPWAPGRAGGEDDPRVVVRARLGRAPRGVRSDPQLRGPSSITPQTSASARSPRRAPAGRRRRPGRTRRPRAGRRGCRRRAREEPLSMRIANALARPDTPCAQPAREPRERPRRELRVGERAVIGVERDRVGVRARPSPRRCRAACRTRAARRSRLRSRHAAARTTARSEWRVLSMAAMAALSKHFGPFLYPPVRFTFG